MTNNKLAQYVNYLVTWIQQYVAQAHMHGVVVGVSGGVDSAVVSLLAQRAFPESHHALFLNCYSTTQDRRDALDHAQQQHLHLTEVNLNQTYDDLLANKSWNKVARINLKPRLRMATLYLYAQQEQALVLGTDNQCEWTMGYFTKFGDGGYDLNPLFHLVKAEVYALAQYLHVSQAIINKAPSAGLTEHQTDEAELGYSYDVIDQFCRQQLQDEKTTAILTKHSNKQVHKRVMPVVPDQDYANFEQKPSNKIIDGVTWAKEWEINLQHQIATYRQATERQPHLAIIQVGDLPASSKYIHHKRQVASRVGIKTSLIHLPQDVTKEVLQQQINILNKDEFVDGYFLQLPLPKHLPTAEVVSWINPAKDVDGLGPYMMGKTMLGAGRFVPAAVKAVLFVLTKLKTSFQNKHIVIVGASNLVGQPLATLLTKAQATVTVCHKATSNLIAWTKQADILIVAAGVVHLIQPEHLKIGSIVIDVGTNYENKQVFGDVDWKACLPLVSAITPVPKGIGPLTITALLHNVLLAVNKNIQTNQFGLEF